MTLGVLVLNCVEVLLVVVVVVVVAGIENNL